MAKKTGGRPSAAVAVSKPSTTFVQADSDNFRSVVQRFTGPRGVGSASAEVPGVRSSQAKLHQRRRRWRHSESKLDATETRSLELERGAGSFSPPTRGPGTPAEYISSLSVEGEGGEKFTAEDLIVSEQVDDWEEERAIKGRRFYLRASPRFRPGRNEPELLALFPLTSPENRE